MSKENDKRQKNERYKELMKKGKNEEGMDEKNAQIKELHYEERKWRTIGKKE